MHTYYIISTEHRFSSQNQQASFMIIMTEACNTYYPTSIYNKRNITSSNATAKNAATKKRILWRAQERRRMFSRWIEDHHITVTVPIWIHVPCLPSCLAFSKKKIKNYFTFIMLGCIMSSLCAVQRIFLIICLKKVCFLKSKALMLKVTSR